MAKKDMAAKKARAERRKIEVLQRVAEHIARAFDGAPECIEASALFVATCELLGYRDAKPEPVLLVAQWNSRGFTVATSEMGAARAVELGAVADDAETERISHEVTDWGGHMIVFTSAPDWLWDPTFAQFRTAGMPDTHLALPAERFIVDDVSWKTDIGGDGDLLVYYELAPGPSGWEHDFGGQVARWADRAKAIADAALSGRS